MTTIKNTETSEITTIECIVDGIDILADVMGGTGVERDEDGFLLDSDDIDWWARWAEREERIADAYADADDQMREEYEQAINEWGHDMEALQDEQERVLGIC